MNEIKKMLNSFYAGTIDNEQEKQLLDYFRSNHTAAEFEKDRIIFMSLYSNQNSEEIPPLLEKKLDNLIDNLAASEAKTHPKHQYLWMYISGAAAAIALIITLGLNFANNKIIENQPLEYAEISPSDQQKIEQAQQALRLVSSKWNKSIAMTSQIDVNLNRLTNNINKIKQLNTKSL
ncbi:MAG: hypothetical protein LBV75_08765 [Paludibacter sp.]|jgi:hypothetical protein|nr:hypothetical protein [Paludibacter sp.]